MPGLTYPFTFVAKTKAKASEVNANFQAIKTLLTITKLDADNIQDGAITEALLAAALKTSIGVGASARGESIIAEPGSRQNNAFGSLDAISGQGAGPDRVQNVVLPDGGLILVRFHALWKDTIGASRKVAVFLGANQVKRMTHAGAPAAYSAGPQGGGTNYQNLATSGSGFAPGGVAPGGTAAESGGITTGQIMAAEELDAATGTTSEMNGGAMAIFADAGTYDVSVQFATTGAATLNVKERRLYVEALPF